MQTNAVDQSLKSLTWKGWIMLSLAAFAIGAFLGIWRPIWFSPPNVKYTILIYLPLAWLAVVVLLVADAKYHPAVTKRVGLSGIIASVILSLLLSGLLILLFAFAPTECYQSTAPDPVRYSCSSSFFFRTTTLTFASLPNFPFMLLTGSSSSTSSFD